MIQVEECTGLILAGGKSSRMGCNKAFLPLNGKSLLQWQTDKFRKLGVKEILISGPRNLEIDGTQTIPDIYPNCGPISGIHAGLAAASCEHCLIISVDTPLIPVQVFENLCGVHETGVTILRHAGGEEPLVGIYDKTVAPILENMIHEGIYSVRKLKENVPFRCREICGLQQEWLCNCNCPEDYARIKCLLKECFMTI